MCAGIFAGCARPDVEEPDPWPVGIAFKYELTDDHISESVQDKIMDYLNELAKGVERHALTVGAYASGDTMQIMLRFASYKSFLRFNGVNPTPEKMNFYSRTISKKAFFVERTITFVNPWIALEDHTLRLDELDHFMRTAGAGVAPEVPTEHIYIFESDTRRTKMSGSYHTENTIAKYNYYYHADGTNAVTEIVVFDRFANQPLWYGLGLAATAIFMGGLYLILRKKTVVTPPTPIVC